MLIDQLVERITQERLKLALASVETIHPYQTYVELAAQAIGLTTTLNLISLLQEEEMERQEKDL